MNIKKLHIDGFKNLNDVNIEFDEKLNIIFGENAQGKTNLVESIWLLSGSRSFRGTKEKDFININSQKAEIELSFKNNFREQNICVTLKKQNLKEKNITLNGVNIKTLPKLFGQLKCVIFTPEDLDLAKGSPEKRRSFIDLCISQIKLGYYSVTDKYENILNQRNALLKRINQGLSQQDELDIWDEQLARMGAYITVLRFNYIKKLDFFAKELYKKMSSEKEILSLEYSSSVFSNIEGRNDYKGEMADEYFAKIKAARREDIRAGFTTIGIHRDDIVTKINNLPSRDFGSQGQQRSIALILKLSQAYILMEETDDAPVILLDDVLSELDSNRQNFILSSIKNMQILITTCDDIKNSLNNTKYGKYFKVECGKVKEVTKQ